MTYRLNGPESARPRVSLGQALARLRPYLRGEGRRLAVAAAAVALSTASTLLAPIIVGRAIDRSVASGDMRGLFLQALLLLGVFAVGLAASYLLTVNMGTVGRGVLWRMRNAIFAKLQELPLAFFNQNQAGDLISRINNDTDKLNQLFAQVIMQFVGNAFLIAGAGILLVALNPRLGLAALVPAAAVFAFTSFTGGWIKGQNAKSLAATGSLSAEIQESLANFRVMIAFGRLDYFRDKFEESNLGNYRAAVSAGLTNGLFPPIYAFATAAAQAVTLAYGIALIASGGLTPGLLVGFFLYVNGFYGPLRQIAAVWSTLQSSMASLDRIDDILALGNDMPSVAGECLDGGSVLEFREVSFAYEDGRQILHDVNFQLERGKTYALVGPTGGGKTTTASLMARLYDPTGGLVLLNGRDIRSYSAAERTAKIGFILQDPFLFTGTVRDNLAYGNPELAAMSPENMEAELAKLGLDALLARFPEGLGTKIAYGSEALSLGQKQIVAFMRAVLRKPEILILDEATANIDTMTEKALDEIIAKLPDSTVKIVIAHRLNTIRDADEIFFVNAGEVARAGSMEHAVEMLMKGHRQS